MVHIEKILEKKTKKKLASHLVKKKKRKKEVGILTHNIKVYGRCSTYIRFRITGRACYLDYLSSYRSLDIY